MKTLSLYLACVFFTSINCDDGSILKKLYATNMKSTKYNATGSFWQLTDIHWDFLYSEVGDKTDMCHNSSENPPNKSIGYYGNYLCDAPYHLVHSALRAMKSIEPQPNFILWTGDNGPHTDEADFPVIFKTIKNVTEEVVSLFGQNIPLIPVLGNHDAYPKDDYPPSGDAFYSRYLFEGNWKEVIPLEAQRDFRKGGYYRRNLQSDVDVLVLNTNLYYKFNELGQGLKDPGGQFEWMKRNLQEVKDSNKKVFIAAHAPPGYWERNAEIPFLNDTYNDEYVDIVNRYGEVIIAHVYGHVHTDSFRIFGTSNDKSRSVGFLAPSITPLFLSRLKGGTAINPSVRLYTFSPSSVLNYIQYHLNLTEANNSTSSESCLASSVMWEVKDCKEESKALWRVYYRATETFRVDSLHVDEMTHVYAKLVSNDTFFQEYFLRNSAGIENGYCNDTCKRNHICAITHLHVESIVDCLNYSHYNDSLSSVSYTTSFTEGTEDGVHSHVVIAVAVGGVSLTVILGVMVVIIIVRRKRILNSGNKTSQFEWLNRNNGYRPLSSIEAD